MTLTEQEVREYESRIAVMGDMFLNFESQFLEFDSVIQYKYNFEHLDKIRSLRLYSLLQGINSSVEAACKLMMEIYEKDTGKQLRKDKEHFFVALNRSGMLSRQAVALVEHPTVLHPFSLDGADVPVWWTAYNKTKHDLLLGIERSTLANIINALGGLLCLLQITSPLLMNKEIEQIFDEKNWRDNSMEFISDYERLKYSSATSAPIHLSNKPFLNSQQDKYRSGCFYYLLEYRPKHWSLR
ncbi:MAG TPA: hypothetical protein VHA09_02305 [Nitrososphaera sp.]|nr:hypothetical protein [Nitrososphaera sp.]